MEYIFELVKSKIEDMLLDGKQMKQIDKVCKMENDFLKDLSQEKQTQYRNLELEKLKSSGLETDRIIQLAIQITKDIYKWQHIV